MFLCFLHNTHNWLLTRTTSTSRIVKLDRSFESNRSSRGKWMSWNRSDHIFGRFYWISDDFVQWSISLGKYGSDRSSVGQMRAAIESFLSLCSVYIICSPAHGSYDKLVNLISSLHSLDFRPFMGVTVQRTRVFSLHRMNRWNEPKWDRFTPTRRRRWIPFQ